MSPSSPSQNQFAGTVATNVAVVILSPATHSVTGLVADPAAVAGGTPVADFVDVVAAFVVLPDFAVVAVVAAVLVGRDGVGCTAVVVPVPGRSTTQPTTDSARTTTTAPIAISSPERDDFFAGGTNPVGAWYGFTGCGCPYGFWPGWPYGF